MRFDRSNTSIIGQWWWTVDRYVLTAIGMIAAIGLVLIMAASPSVAEHIGLSQFHFVKRQMVFLTIGIACMGVFSLMSLVTLRRIAALGFVACIALLVIVLLAGHEVKGATRWIRLAGVQLQPSEFIKPFFTLVTAWVLARKTMVQGYPGFRIAIVLYLLVAGLLLAQPDVGMTIAISVVWGAQMFIAGLPMVWVITIALLGGGGMIVAYFNFPHVAHRINSFLDPAAGDNYQVGKSLEAIINGGFLGVGPGQGVIKGRVPDAHTDFIFAVAGEEFGTIACIIIVALFAFIVIRGFIHILSDNNLFVVLAASGLLIQFSIQAIINMGVALNLLPNTGMTLPFISYGGSSTLAVSIAMGMILAFTRKRFGEV